MKPSIILKDGSIPKKDKYGNLIERGTLLRFRKGNTAIMRVDRAEQDNFGWRLYGMNIMGDHHAAYAHDCLPVTEEDKKTWQAYSTARLGSYLQEEYA